MYISECLDGDLLWAHYKDDGSHVLLTGEGGSIVRADIDKMRDVLAWLDIDEPGWVPGHFVWIVSKGVAKFTGLWYWNQVRLTHKQVLHVNVIMKELRDA